MHPMLFDLCSINRTLSLFCFSAWLNRRPNV